MFAARMTRSVRRYPRHFSIAFVAVILVFSAKDVKSCQEMARHNISVFQYRGEEAAVNDFVDLVSIRTDLLRRQLAERTESSDAYSSLRLEDRRLLPSNQLPDQVSEIFSFLEHHHPETLIAMTGYIPANSDTGHTRFYHGSSFVDGHGPDFMRPIEENLQVMAPLNAPLEFVEADWNSISDTHSAIIVFTALLHSISGECDRGHSHAILELLNEIIDGLEDYDDHSLGGDILQVTGMMDAIRGEISPWP